MDFKYKFKTFAKLSLLDSDSDKVLHKEVASHMDVALDSQPDLLYFKAIYLTEGVNGNGAVFHREELLKALGSIYHKAMDIEHEEDGIVGHIYAASFADEDGNVLEKNAAKEYDGKLDIAIAGIVYRDRFPELADEIEKGDWFVSMETYYKDFYLTVGKDLRIDRDHADIDKFIDYIGHKVTVSENGEEVANDYVYRHMIGLHFCGGGFVKKPANPTSVVFETASKKDGVFIELTSSKPKETEDDEIVIKLTASIDRGIEESYNLDGIETYISQSIDTRYMEEEMYAELSELQNVMKAFREDAAKWTRAYINSLPDSAFVIIEPAYKNGSTDNKNARHLPYKDKNGKIDPAHLRNAAARCSQLKAVTDSISTSELRKKACARVQSLVKKHLKKK